MGRTMFSHLTQTISLIRSFQQQIKGADAVSLRHTEYNRSVPGALENAERLYSV